MGYDLHITRRTEWADPDSGPPISRAEFERVVLGDARFERDEPNGPDHAVLARKLRDGEDPPWLCWQNGEIITKNPPQSFIRLAVEIAGKLNARVVGDDDEEYGKDGQAVSDEVKQRGVDSGRDVRSDARLVKSGVDMRKQHQRESAVRILKLAGIAAFCAMAVALLGRQLGLW